MKIFQGSLLKVGNIDKTDLIFFRQINFNKTIKTNEFFFTKYMLKRKDCWSVYSQRSLK